MKVLWLGMNDEGGCVLHWHKLRLELEKLGVTLVGPGYFWPGEGHISLSHILSHTGMPDWIVLDDCNAKGYVPIVWDVMPPCLVAWREHDFHNRHRQSAGHRIDPDLILGCYKRGKQCKSDPFRDHPEWTFVPHAVDTDLFRPQRDKKWELGLYGACNNDQYVLRRDAKKALAGRGWVGQHTGYWHDGTERSDGIKSFYNDHLADVLGQVKAVWVDGGWLDGIVLKYFEQYIVLIGKKRFFREIPSYLRLVYFSIVAI